MLRFLPFIFLINLACSAELTSPELLARVRAQVARQISAVAKYSCVLTIDRTLYYKPEGLGAGCAAGDLVPEKPFMQDRLRLDVAVSEGNEIYSWHGGREFSPTGVNDIVKSGPISSGSFIGYLRNILFVRGVALSVDPSQTDEERTTFNYYVPLNSSAYQIAGRRGHFTVPFYGSFAVKTGSYELESLTVAVGEIPRAAEVCSVNANILYQKFELLGKPLLTPETFELHLLDANGIDTFSESTYTQCREFRGESTLRFDMDDSQQNQSAPAFHDQWLPGGLRLHVRLTTAVDDKASFTGDPVHGILLDSVRVKTMDLTIPKGALLSGVVSRLELRYQPIRHYLVAIHWDRLTFGQNSLLLNANPQRVHSQRPQFGSTYSRAAELAAGETGVFIRESSHLRLGPNFAADYDTAERPKQLAAAKGN